MPKTVKVVNIIKMVARGHLYTDSISHPIRNQNTMSVHIKLDEQVADLFLIKKLLNCFVWWIIYIVIRNKYVNWKKNIFSSGYTIALQRCQQK